ncbi:hypothetical protein DRQ36_01200 [bacterium]|nr:MAG: hypothetical protein DRQ36_01200 [bacterium]
MSSSPEPTTVLHWLPEATTYVLRIHARTSERSYSIPEFPAIVCCPGYFVRGINPVMPFLVGYKLALAPIHRRMGRSVTTKRDYSAKEAIADISIL